MNALLERGCDVYVVAPEDEYSKNFPKFIAIKNLDRKGKDPIRDVKLLWEYISLYKRIKPDLVLNFTIKPNIYSSLACRLLGIKCISTITGLRYVFVKEALVHKPPCGIVELISSKKYHKRDRSKYGKRLVRRGSITMWIFQEAISLWFSNKPEKKGRPQLYNDIAYGMQKVELLTRCKALVVIDMVYIDGGCIC
ncbi:MAG: glycosyltransferase [Alishewanella aestuarii]